MPLDLLGPASAPNAVTARPADGRTLGAADSWFKDCTSLEVPDGTEIQAATLNAWLAQMRRAIRGMGIAERPLTDPAVDDMLLDAIKAIGDDAVTFTKARAALQLHPEIQTTAGTLALTATTGQIVVDAAQFFTLRGVERFATDAYSLAQRTFATVASKTYHLRFDRTNGFRLLDLASPGYNPTSAAETVAGFDSTHDDMLIARIVTNGSNALTVTALVNRILLKASVQLNVSTGTGNARSGSWSSALNWARSPTLWVAFGSRSYDEATAIDQDEQAIVTGSTRYAAAGTWLVDFPEAGGIQLNIGAVA